MSNLQPKRVKDKKAISARKKAKKTADQRALDATMYQQYWDWGTISDDR